MKRLDLTQRTARMLYDFVQNKAQPVDYADEQRIKHIKEKLFKAQGPFAAAMAAIIKTERAERRRCRDDIQKLNAAIALINYDVEDAIEIAREHKVSIKLEDADFATVQTLATQDEKYSAADYMIDDTLALLESLKNAETIPDENIVVKERNDEPTENGHVDEPDNLRELATAGKSGNKKR